jgi:hypothetical protein
MHSSDSTRSKGRKKERKEGEGQEREKKSLVRRECSAAYLRMDGNGRPGWRDYPHKGLADSPREESACRIIREDVQDVQDTWKAEGSAARLQKRLSSFYLELRGRSLAPGKPGVLERASPGRRLGSIPTPSVSLAPSLRCRGKSPRR